MFGDALLLVVLVVAELLVVLLLVAVVLLCGLVVVLVEMVRGGEWWPGPCPCADSSPSPCAGPKSSARGDGGDECCCDCGCC